MMRLTCATFVAILISAPISLQSNRLLAQQTAPVPSYARNGAQGAGGSAQGAPAAEAPIARVAAQGNAPAPNEPIGQPFPSLSPTAQI